MYVLLSIFACCLLLFILKNTIKQKIAAAANIHCCYCCYCPTWQQLLLPLLLPTITRCQHHHHDDDDVDDVAASTFFLFFFFKHFFRFFFFYFGPPKKNIYCFRFFSNIQLLVEFLHWWRIVLLAKCCSRKRSLYIYI